MGNSDWNESVEANGCSYRWWWATAPEEECRIKEVESKSFDELITSQDVIRARALGVRLT